MTERHVAIVTGGGSGIGRATAELLARRGYDVALLGRDPGRLGRTAKAISDAHGVRAEPIACDVGDAAQVDAAARDVLDTLGVPRVVVNNAGVVHRASIEDTTPAAWDSVLATNLRGPYLVARAFVSAMKRERRGRIVHVGSISSTLGTRNLTAYCASKWGLVGLTKSLAEELRGTGLQTLAVLPGSVDTEMLVGSGFAPQMTAADVAGTIVYCALEAPDAMNGSCVEVFGA
jgi:3-oxoacyl-[acyl-carrier protein] reductase